MEIWPRLVDWKTFQEKYKPGAPTEDWTVPPDYAHPCDVGSMNVGTVDAFLLMQAHLPSDVREALGTFIVHIATVEVEGWPHKEFAPTAIKNHALYSPESVRRVLSKLDSVDHERFTNEVKKAWTKMSTDPKDWMYVDADYWDHTDSCGDFLDYVFGWRDAFQEAAKGGYGLMIDAG